MIGEQIAHDIYTYLNDIGICLHTRDLLHTMRTYRDAGFEFNTTENNKAFIDYVDPANKLTRFANKTLTQYRIPHLMHIIWITDPDNPREFSKEDRDYAIDRFSTLYNTNSNWLAYFWTNIPY